MVATPRKVEIRDGKIALPEDMLEQGGIGTSSGVVIVDLRASGEIVLRASTPAPKELSASPALAAIRNYAKTHPQTAASAHEQIDDWQREYEQGVAEEMG